MGERKRKRERVRENERDRERERQVRKVKHIIKYGSPIAVCAKDTFIYCQTKNVILWYQPLYSTSRDTRVDILCYQYLYSTSRRHSLLPILLFDW